MQNLIASTLSEPPAAVCSSSGRGSAPPFVRTNRPHKDRYLSKLLQLAIAIHQKDIMAIYSTMPKEQVVPLIATTAAVSLIKVAAIAGGILLMKWIIAKVKNK